MKIGILTFHRAHNYGAVLQAYALQMYLTSIGHDVEFIDYRPKYIDDPYKIINQQLIYQRRYKEFIASVISIHFRIARRTKFRRFIKKYLIISSRRVYKKDEIPPDYDVYIFGSDQIWNLKLTNGADEIYWGFFNVNKSAIKVSYAPSMESISQSKGSPSFFTDALKNFDYISVRESDLKSYLQMFTTKKIFSVVDPVLLHHESFWNSIKKKPKRNLKYVLLYDIRVNSKTEEIAYNVARELGVAVLKINAWPHWRPNRTHYQCVSPTEFLGLIDSAECVVSTSFHCIAFSILFKRPFYTYELKDGSDSRVKSLLTNLMLNDRIVSDSSSLIYSEIDFSISHASLEDLRKHSCFFLSQIMQL